ncbi:integration host factor subunit beta [SAR116 cluster bacterium]|nr:integration host factor subunit beta [SAR116 cluster bacterium]
MTKSELINKIANKYPTLYLSDIEKIVFTIINVVTENIAKGNRVELRGFGTFGLKELKARKSRNPRTGATVFVEKKHIPYFRMGKKLKERINL